jgi:two-component system sensor histidine kinase KdpD
VKTLFQNLTRSYARRYAAAVFAASAITGAMILSDIPLQTVTIAMIYLLGVLVIATTMGLGPGIVTSGLCLVAFNFFFVAPRYTFHVDNPQNALHLATFLAVAVIASTLAARARGEADRVQRQAAELAALYELSQAIGAQVDLDRILPIIAETTRVLLDVPACTLSLYNDAGQLVERARVGAFAPNLALLRIPIRDGAAVLGVLCVAERTPRGGFSAGEQQLLSTLAAQTRLAIDRARLVAQEAHNQALSESDQLKSALLASVSHDLRTPLAIVKGASTTLLAEEIRLDAATQRELTQTIDGQVDHLNQLVGDLLDMSRIEAGALPTERDWHDLAEVIGVAIQRLEARLGDRPLTLDIAPDLPLVLLNPVLIGQVITNLLENALKHTPAGSPITILARHSGGPLDTSTVVVTVRDAGPGLRPADRAHVFDKFYRGRDGDGHLSGVGLGLAICKGFVEAHGGRIWAEGNTAGGTDFVFTLPQSSPPPVAQGAGELGAPVVARIGQGFGV